MSNECCYKCKKMINRINLILRAKNITAKQFAEEIGIQPSGMSHILGGRNNPSLEFVAKVLRRYPELDANWLLLGRGSMYNSSAAVQQVAPEVREKRDDERDDRETSDMPTETVSEHSSVLEDGVGEEPRPLVEIPDSELFTPEESARANAAEEAAPRLVKMLLIYDDNTFVECRPQ